jgi:hypothetical protein
MNGHLHSFAGSNSVHPSFFLDLRRALERPAHPTVVGHAAAIVIIDLPGV